MNKVIKGFGYFFFVFSAFATGWALYLIFYGNLSDSTTVKLLTETLPWIGGVSVFAGVMAFVFAALSEYSESLDEENR